MSKITLKVNGSTHTLDIDPATPLLYILRNDLGLQGPRFGCGLGQCGACTVIVDGEAVFSCLTPVALLPGRPRLRAPGSLVGPADAATGPEDFGSFTSSHCQGSQCRRVDGRCQVNHG